MGERGTVPAKGALSALLDELAASPERDPGEAWDRGLRPGERVGKFELLREIGRGGFGVVLEARDLELGRLVAFKALRPGVRARDPAREELLRREAEAVAQLQHPNIVTLFDFGRCASGPYLVLELLRGETLAGRLSRGPLPPREAVAIGADVARALVHAHGQGVLHRDLKPGNVFLADPGGTKVLDFGLAHVFGAGGPAGSGTPGYMAPEQAGRAAEDERTDVFALGVLLHEAVSGGRPPGPDPGAPPPRVDAPGVPPALADLVARSLDPDPARRPRDAREVLDGLLAIERAWAERDLAARRGRRRRLAAAGTALAIVAAIAGWLAGSRASRSGRTLAVADAVNATDDRSLDALSGMLATSLEQSTRLAVIPRARLADLVPEAGGRPLDPDAAREAARRAGADELLVPSVKREGPGYVLEVRRADPRSGATLSVLREPAASRAEIQDAIDRLALATRRDLRDPGVAPPVRELTASLDAYRHYFLGRQCADRPLYGQDCTGEFRRAIALDPGFAAAHYELAILLRYYGGSLAAQRAEIARAVANADRAPSKERLLIRAWAAHLDGRDDDALATYRDVTRAFPQDARAFFEMGDILRHRDELAAAIPWFERAAALDPGAAWGLGHLVEALGALGRRGDLEAWARRWEEAPSPPTLHGLALARGWLGDVRGATDAARRSAALGGGLIAQEDMLGAVVFAGQYEAAEGEFRVLATRGSEVRRIGYWALAALEAYQGRRRAGLAALDDMRRDVPEVRSDGLYHSIRADYLLGDGDPGPVREAVRALRAIDPAAAAEHAPALAWLGDRAEAATLARALPPGSALARTHEALELWHRGDRDGALRTLRDVSAESPMVVWRLAPLYLYADLAARAGRDREALDALERFQRLYVPRMMWRSWAWPRSLLLAARARERLGDAAGARQSVDRLLAELRGADPDYPLLAEARALRARLAAPRPGAETSP